MSSDSQESDGSLPEFLGSSSDMENPCDLEDWGISTSYGPQTPHQDSSRTTLLPSSGPARSSPIVGNRQQIKEIRSRKAQKKRLATYQKKTESKKAAQDIERKTALQHVMDVLHSQKLIFWDLLEYIFNPENQQGEIRYNEFFIKKDRITKILDWWLSANQRSQQAKEEIKQWIMNYVAIEVAYEARTITKSKKLQTFSQNLGAETVKDFDLGRLNTMLHEPSSGAPLMMCLLEAFATSRHVKKHSDSRQEKTRMVSSIEFR